MTWLDPLPKPHECTLPRRWLRPIGARWMCDCGRAWVLARRPGYKWWVQEGSLPKPVTLHAGTDAALAEVLPELEQLAARIDALKAERQADYAAHDAQVRELTAELAALRTAPDDVTEQATGILIEHARTQIEGCHCGWGHEPIHLGKSHARHVVDAFAAAGLLRTAPDDLTDAYGAVARELARRAHWDWDTLPVGAQNSLSADAVGMVDAVADAGLLRTARSEGCEVTPREPQEQGPFGDLSNRLVQAAAKAIHETFDPSFPADEWVDEARAATMAVLRTLADTDAWMFDLSDLTALADDINPGDKT